MPAAAKGTRPLAWNSILRFRALFSGVSFGAIGVGSSVEMFRPLCLGLQIGPQCFEFARHLSNLLAPHHFELFGGFRGKELL